jgi:hypothetical protein
MDVDPITDSEAIAELAYDAMIGSEFEQVHGWHVNLMPPMVLREFAPDWRTRAETACYGNLTAADLIAAKLKRNEPRDRAHKVYAETLHLL